MSVYPGEEVTAEVRLTTLDKSTGTLEMTCFTKKSDGSKKVCPHKRKDLKAHCCKSSTSQASLHKLENLPLVKLPLCFIPMLFQQPQNIVIVCLNIVVDHSNIDTMLVLIVSQIVRQIRLLFDFLFCR